MGETAYVRTMERRRNWGLAVMWSVLTLVDFVVFVHILNRPHMAIEYLVLVLGLLLCANGISGALRTQELGVQTDGSPFWRMFDRNFLHPAFETLPYSKRRIVWDCCGMIISGVLVGSSTSLFIRQQDWISLLVGVLAALNAVNTARKMYLTLPPDHASELVSIEEA